MTPRAGPGRGPVVERLPVLGAGDRAGARGGRGGGARSRPASTSARSRREADARARALPGLADRPGGRRGHPGARRQSRRANVPRLPAFATAASRRCPTAPTCATRSPAPRRRTHDDTSQPPDRRPRPATRACPTPAASWMTLPMPRRGAGDRRRVDVQPLPLRARLARPADRRRARLRGAGRALPRTSTPTTPTATRTTPLEAMRERVEAEDWPHPYLHDDDQDGGARLGAADDPRCLRARLGSGACATAARPTPTTTIPARTPPGCARRSTPCSPARAPDPAETEPVGCSLKWKPGDAVTLRRRLVTVPRLLGQPGAGLRRASPRRSRSTSSWRWSRPTSSRSTPAAIRCRRTARTSAFSAFETLHPADGLRFEIRSDIPIARGLGSSAAAIVAGLIAADHLYELAHRAGRHLPPRGRAGGPSRQRRRRAVRRHRAVPARRGRRAPRAGSPRAARGRRADPRGPARARSRRRRRGRRCRPRSRSTTPSPTSPRPRSSALGIERSDLTLIGRGLADRLHQPHRAELFPRLDGASSPRRATSARSAPRSRAPGRPCWSGASGRTPARCRGADRAAPRAGRRSSAPRSRQPAPTSRSSSPAHGLGGADRAGRAGGRRACSDGRWCSRTSART